MGRKKKEEESFELSNYQLAIIDFIKNGQGNLVVEAGAGAGKCLGKGTKVIMFDGTIKKVEDIVPGDLLMGDDSNPRVVLSTTNGYGELCKIIPKKGEPWICNDVHILTVDYYRKKQKNNVFYGEQIRYDISIDELEKNMRINGLKVNKHKDGDFRQIKLVKPSRILFSEKKLFLDPYVYGVWLGDGTTAQACITSMDEEIITEIKNRLPEDYFITENTNCNSGKAKQITIHCKDTWHNKIRRFLRNSSINKEKFIYHDYLTSSYHERLELLAGLIDTDGYYSHCNYYISAKSDLLCNNILFLCRSLGLSAYDSILNKKCHNDGVVKKYHNITISGNVDMIPVRLNRKKAKKRKIKKDNLHNGFRIEHIGKGEYYGFTLDGNGRFLLEDFTITHNTHTLIQCIKEISGDKRILLTAFNRDIVNVLKKKSKGMLNVDVCTMHSLGLQMLQKNFPNEDLILDEFKYKSYLNTNIKSLSSINTYELSKRDFARYMQNIEMLINFGRCYLCETVKDLEFIEDRYGISSIADEKEIALDVLEFGKNNLSQVDYTDMIWLPNVLYCKPIGMQYDWIFADEVQDLSVCQREILLKCRKINTRLICFGDKNQCLYAFSSACPESFENLKSLPNTASLPLSISYRCSKNIVEFANKIVPELESNNDGRIGEIKYDVPLEEINDGDMVLCRNNAPLMQVYVNFIKQGKKCFIRGKDIGLNLKNMVKRTGISVLNKNLQYDGVFVRLYDALFDMINEMVCKYNITYADAIESALISNRLDSIKALEILSDDINTSDELIEKIDTIFSDRKKGGISLSTIHKAKGLESDNVYIVCKSLMPSSKAKKDWEIRQEYNLMYVAYTRAKNILGFVDESEFNSFLKKSSESINKLKAIENQVNYVLKKERKKIEINNEFIANDIIRHATVIEKPKVEYKVMPLIKEKNNNVVNFNDIFKKRFIKK